LTSEEIRSWRETIHRQGNSGLGTRGEVLTFIKSVGFCFAFGPENGDTPSLGAALVQGEFSTGKINSGSSRMDIRKVIPSGAKVYLGRLLKNKPTIVSPEFLTFFYALSRRSGALDEHTEEHRKGTLSSAAQLIMQALMEESPQATFALRLASGLNGTADRKKFEHALGELQKKMFIVQSAGGVSPAQQEWDILVRRFPKEATKSHLISEEEARARVLGKYCQNQLVVTVPGIQKFFGWEKQEIFRALGFLKREGTITPEVRVDGRDGKFYAFIH
jgi:hypothetical protein